MKACAWCEGEIPKDARRDSVFCRKRCRQAAFRLRGRAGELEARQARGARPLRMAYADPPYPGLAKRYYGSEASFAGEVNHVELLERLSAYDGWALSTGEFALRELLPLCPHGARTCPWVKPVAPNPRTFGLHGTWEPLIVVPGRRLRPGKRDWLFAAPARLGGSKLAGRKPLAFVAWLFEVLGLLPGDELEDLYPGSGVVSAAWRELGGRVAHAAAATRRAAAPADTSRSRGERPVAEDLDGRVALELAATRPADVDGDGPESRRAKASGDIRPAPALGDASRVGRRRRIPLGPASDRPTS